MKQTERADWRDGMRDVMRVLKGHTRVAVALGYRDLRNVYPWTSLERPLPVEKAPALELATANAGECVPVDRICPDAKWQRVKDKDWPHPDGRPCLDIVRTLAPATPRG